MVDRKLNVWISKCSELQKLSFQIFEISKTNGTINGESEVQDVADTISRKHKGKVLASSISGFDYPAIAIISLSSPPATFTQQSGSEYKLNLKESKLQLEFKNEGHRRALGNIISHAIQNQIRPLLGVKLWQRSSRSRRYCELKPERIRETSDPAKLTNYNLFRGFSYRIDIFPNGWVGVSADIHSTVLDALSLAERVKIEGMDSFSESWKNTYVAIADKGGQYKVRYIMDLLLNASISTFKVQNKLGGEVSVFNLYNGTHPVVKKPLDNNDIVIKITTFSGSTDPQYVPASCVYGILSTDELEEDKDIARHLTMPANKRLENINYCRQNYLKLDQVAIPGACLRFEKQLVGSSEFKSGKIDLPVLKFSRGKLKPDELPAINMWRNAKESSVKRYGWYRPSLIEELLIIHPHMDKHELMIFYQDLKNQAKELGEDLPSDPTYRETSNYNDILRDLGQYQDRFDAAVVVFKEWDDEAYRRMKKNLRIPSQGVQLSTIRSKARLTRSGKEQYYRDILLNILSGLLGKSGAIPWVIDTNLSSDCYIGVDSGGAESRVWSYAYLFDSKGEYVGSKCGQAIQGESIEKGRFKNSILEALGEYRSGTGEGPKKIIIHRDGRLTHSERDGLIEAVHSMIHDGQLRDDVSVAAVDIKKSHPFRIFEEGREGYQNPTIGSYFLFDDRRCIINTTGFPVLAPQVTAHPLLLDMDPIIGQFDILDMAKDVFYLSELNWGSPKMNIKMPITIRFAEKRIEYADKSIEFADQIPL